jgi:hypothetical protein
MPRAALLCGSSARRDASLNNDGAGIPRRATCGRLASNFISPPDGNARDLASRRQ